MSPDHLAVGSGQQERVADVAVLVADQGGPADVDTVPAGEVGEQPRRRAVDVGGPGAEIRRDGHPGGEELGQHDPLRALPRCAVHLLLAHLEVVVDVAQLADDLHRRNPHR